MRSSHFLQDPYGNRTDYQEKYIVLAKSLEL